jgi:Ni/Fe-hydrogenase subunit HybB-like protein
MIKTASIVGIVLTVLAAAYELINFMSVDPRWMKLIMSGSPISWMYWGWIILGIVIPFLLFLTRKPSMALLGAISALIGTFLMRQAFIYGGNIVPMTDRFGTGPEATSLYGLAELKPWAYVAPHTMEILVIIGCLGLGLAIYSILDNLFDVRNINDNADH